MPHALQVSVFPRPDWTNATYFTSLTGVLGNRSSFEKHEFLSGKVQHPDRCPGGCSGRGICTSDEVTFGNTSATVHRCWCMQVGGGTGAGAGAGAV
jgi:hypothetical protein